MAKILEREELAPRIVRFLIDDPELARVQKAGQFLILRANADSERIPLSIADADPNRGTIEIVVQEVGKSSAVICSKQVGEHMHDVVGPLGTPTHIEKFGTAVCVGGGVGIAPLYPIAKALRDGGNRLISILGGRSRPFVILEDRMRSISDEVIVTTDDGSYGHKGFVTDALRDLLEDGRRVDFCLTVGPPIMMQRVSETTRPYKIPTWASLNTLMVDGTGMCGGCRVRVGGETKYVCVDGPEFDAHQVDFDEMMRRMAMYDEFERRAYERFRSSSPRDEDSCKIGLDR